MLLMLFILFGAFCNACLSYFLDACFEQGMIFQGWIPFLYRTIGEKSFFFKPLGGCVVCSNIWQGLITFPIVAHYFLAETGPVLLLYGLAYLLISNFFIRKMI